MCRISDSLSPLEILGREKDRQVSVPEKFYNLISRLDGPIRTVTAAGGIVIDQLADWRVAALVNQVVEVYNNQS
jgi:hypothetical protein